MHSSHTKKRGALVFVETEQKRDTMAGLLGAEFSVLCVPLVAAANSADMDRAYAIQQAIRRAREIILAFDDDERGEYAAWKCCELFGLPVDKCKRAIFRQLTARTLYAALLQTPGGRIRMPMVQAYQARMDGAGSSGVARTMRALQWIHEREQSVSETKKAVVAYFTAMMLPCTGTVAPPTGAVYRLRVVGAAECTETSAPGPLTATELLQLASSMLRMSPQKTRAAAQRLYEQGWITFPDMTTTDKDAGGKDAGGKDAGGKDAGGPTEEGKVDDDDDDVATTREIGKYIESAYGEAFVCPPSSTFRTAIRPVSSFFPQQQQEQHSRGSQQEPADRRDRALFRLIWMRTVQSCMPPARFQHLKLCITGTSSSCESCEFTRTITRCVFPGFHRASSPQVCKGFEKDEEEYNYVSRLAPDSIVECHAGSGSDISGSGSDISGSMVADLVQQQGMVWGERADDIVDTHENIHARTYATCDAQHSYRLTPHGRDILKISRTNPAAALSSSATAATSATAAATAAATATATAAATSSSVPTRVLGKYRGQDLVLKCGKYGLYAQWGDKRRSLRGELKTTPMETMAYMDVVKFLDENEPAELPPGVIRELSPHVCLRSGKYGDYIYFKKPRIAKPFFYKLAGFAGDYRACGKELIVHWIQSTYPIDAKYL